MLREEQNLSAYKCNQEAFKTSQIGKKFHQKNEWDLLLAYSYRKGIGPRKCLTYEMIFKNHLN